MLLLKLGVHLVVAEFNLVRNECQGTTLVVPNLRKKRAGFSPCGIFAIRFTNCAARQNKGAAGNIGEFHMEVILKEDVDNLGHRGDVVKVAEGYGRNFLLPRKLAMQATEANKAVIEQMKSAAARRSASEKAVAEALVAKLEPLELSFTRKSGEEGRLFGSVTSADIATELAANGFEIDRRKIQLPEPLKTVGDFSVAVKLHREVTAHVKVKVVAEATEGEEAAVAQPAAQETAAE
jgi:large subunit ribosomal protein L9